MEIGKPRLQIGGGKKTRRRKNDIESGRRNDLIGFVGTKEARVWRGKKKAWAKAPEIQDDQG